MYEELKAALLRDRIRVMELRGLRGASGEHHVKQLRQLESSWCCGKMDQRATETFARTEAAPLPSVSGPSLPFFLALSLPSYLPSSCFISQNGCCSESFVSLPFVFDSFPSPRLRLLPFPLFLALQSPCPLSLPSSPSNLVSSHQTDAARCCLLPFP